MPLRFAMAGVLSVDLACEGLPESLIGKRNPDEPFSWPEAFTYPLFGDQPEGPVYTRIAEI